MRVALETSRHCTYADYLSWPADVRCELIDGTPLLMAPAPTVTHQIIVGEVYHQLRRALNGHPCRPLVSPVDVRLPKADEADEFIDTVVQPDVLVVCDETGCPIAACAAPRTGCSKS